GRLVAVVGEVLAALHVVLVVVGPVEHHLLAVIGNGVALVLGIAPLGDEVALLVVAAKEGEQVVVDGGFLCVIRHGAGSSLAQFLVLLANRRAEIGRSEITVGIQRG